MLQHIEGRICRFFSDPILHLVFPVSFKLYDLDGDGFIDKSELFIMLRAAMLERAELELTEKQLTEIVEQTFSMVSKDNTRIAFGTIIYIAWILAVLTLTLTQFVMEDEYKALMMEQPTLLGQFSINLDELMSNA